ncbi:MAG: PIG-L family deacetylase [Myxococcales bacterium]|nr:MAG: PIG-L family deacetylase [Myxococcales bacterium]
MSLSQGGADVFVPDGSDAPSALARTTHLAVGAHQDDLELMAAHGVMECFQNPARWFTGVVVTDGRGSARDFEYQKYTDEQMMAVRRLEQRKAAYVGEYSAMLQLFHSSQEVKTPPAPQVVRDLAQVLELSRPNVVYTHNLADKHDTHVAVALRVVAACLELPAEARPQRIIGCEVWRDLDWLCDEDKVVMPVSRHENLHAALMGVFDSQIAGGKRYDLATAGRRRAHATYFESHEADGESALSWGMDLTPLLQGADPAQLLKQYLARFEGEVTSRVARLR